MCVELDNNKVENSGGNKKQNQCGRVTAVGTCQVTEEDVIYPRGRLVTADVRVIDVFIRWRDCKTPDVAAVGNELR